MRRILGITFLFCTAIAFSQMNQQEQSQTSADRIDVEKTVKANYPKDAFDRFVQGRVLLRVRVSETGDVNSVEVTSGNPMLTGAAIEAVRQWKFRPLIKDGKAVPAVTSIPIDFSIPGIKNCLDETSRQSFVQVPQSVSEGYLMHAVSPVYPDVARAARIQGPVVLCAVIDTQGKVKNVEVAGGRPELSSSAKYAVQQWRYRPYVVDGKPVDVKTQVVVWFRLGSL